MARLTLTITNTMALLATVVALHDNLFLLNLVRWTILGNVTIFVAVDTLGLAATDRLTSILETLHIFFSILREGVTLTVSGRLVVEAVCDSVLLVEIALKVHSGQSSNQVLLDGNDVNTDILGSKGLLKLNVSKLRQALEILLEGLLDIIHVSLLSGLADLVPGGLRVHVRNL